MKNFWALLLTGLACITVTLLITSLIWGKHQHPLIDDDDFTKAAVMGKDAVVFLFVLTSDTSTIYQGNQTGSGVIIAEDGYIVTNYHVVKGGTVIHVLLNDKREYHAHLVGIDSLHDVALIKIPAKNLPVLAFGDSDSIRVGEKVMAVGNPYKLQSTVTSGIISAFDREIDLPGNMTYNFIQTDVPINLGNSGGALINRYGQLIGLNIAYISNSGAYEGFSFAIPSNLVKKLTTDLRDHGSIQKASLGIMIRPVSPEIAHEVGLPEIYGIVVDAVTPGASADSSGVQSLDVLTHIDGVRIESSSQFRGKLDMFRPNDVMTLRVLRGREKIEIKVKMRRRSEG